MRAIGYFDRDHDIDPSRAALIDADTGDRFTFAEVKARTEAIAAALYAHGFANQQPVALYAPNSAPLMIALLAIWRANAEGYVYIVDRKTDMVVSRGFNVFTTEVGAPITQLPQVRERAVSGIPHEKWGEAVHAIVVADGVDEAAVITHAKARLGGVKAPKSVAFVEAIPRTAAGKMDKKALRIQHWGDSARMVN